MRHSYELSENTAPATREEEKKIENTSNDNAPDVCRICGKPTSECDRG